MTLVLKVLQLGIDIDNFLAILVTEPTLAEVYQYSSVIRIYLYGVQLVIRHHRGAVRESNLYPSPSPLMLSTTPRYVSVLQLPGLSATRSGISNNIYTFRPANLRSLKLTWASHICLSYSFIHRSKD